MLNIPLTIPGHIDVVTKAARLFCAQISLTRHQGTPVPSDHKGEEENWHTHPSPEKKSNAESAAEWNRLQHLPREEDRAEQLIWVWAVNQDWLHTQPQTGWTNMQASYHCNFLANLFLSKRSENNQEVVQKNTGKSSHVPMVKPVGGKDYKNKCIYLKTAYFSCQDLPLLFFFFRAMMRLSSCQPSVLVNLQN